MFQKYIYNIYCSDIIIVVSVWKRIEYNKYKILTNCILFHIPKIDQR